MLEYSKNHHISEAYKRILEAQSLPQREYAYHCTNVNPNIIKSQGFSNKVRGFTSTNQFHSLYEKYLPESKCFVSKEPWESSAFYIIKIDITGLEKYPDFGQLIECGAYFEEIEDNDYVFWWEDKNIYPLKSDFVPKKLADFLMKSTEDNTLYSYDFDGEMSWELVGTCCVDGKYITPERIVDITVNESTISESNEDKTDWKKVSAIKHNIEERDKMLTPAEFSSCLSKKRNGGVGVELNGNARQKIVSPSNGLVSSTNIIISEDDNPNTLIFDVDMEPLRDWDSTPLDKLIDYVGKYAPWIHLDRRIDDQKHMFARFLIRDSNVVNSYRKLIGKNDERTDYVQMDLFDGT